MKIALVQFTPGGDTDRIRRKVEQHVRAARTRGADLVCLPELGCHPWFLAERDPDPAPHAAPPGGELEGWARALARDAGVALVLPFCERSVQGVYHNSALVVEPDGSVAGRYRKVHLPDIPGWPERRVFAPGDLGFPVFRIGDLTLGVQLGWDHFFPEGFRCLALAGAHAVIVPTAAAYATRERWLAMGVSHAIANGVYVARVNRVGSEAGLDFYGHSFVVRPDGDLVAEPMPLGEGIFLAELDVGAVEEARRTWPFLRDRRPRQYAAVAGVRWPETAEGLPDAVPEPLPAGGPP